MNGVPHFVPCISFDALIGESLRLYRHSKATWPSELSWCPHLGLHTARTHHHLPTQHRFGPSVLRSCVNIYFARYYTASEMRVTIHVFTTKITIIRIIFIPGLVAFSHLALSKHQLTILFLFALTVTLNLTVKLLDFKGAFLHARWTGLPTGSKPFLSTGLCSRPRGSCRRTAHFVVERYTQKKNELLFVFKAVKPSYGWYPCPSRTRVRGDGRRRRRLLTGKRWQ